MSKDSFLRWFYYRALILIYRLLAPYTIIGRENLPSVSEGPFLIVANHFSYFDIPLLGLILPHEKLRFFASPDSMGEFRLIDSFLRVFDQHVIFVRRGTADRESLKRGRQALQKGDWLVIFPEGGVTLEAIEVANTGQSTVHMQGRLYSRESGELLPPRPGTALLALQTNAAVLPIAIWGTEKIENNLRRRRRTRLTVQIGKQMAPMAMPDGVRGRERRAYMDKAGHDIMQAIADLMPEVHRGPYR